MNKTTVCITGATGTMGFATLEELSGRLSRFNLRLLVRRSARNEKKLARFIDMEGVEVIWGDLLDPASIAEALDGCDIVLHIGGMVSPEADHHPDKTMKVNVGSMLNIISAIEGSGRSGEVKVVYVGSVAETSHRDGDCIWGRIGDPVIAGVFDYYSLSKIIAERELAESGIKRWVSLRQSGILHAGLLYKGNDPITFHVPLNGGLEWTTLEDSARLMANVCERDVPERFWNNFYNIGSGPSFRLTNYEFECMLLKALHCPPPEKVFEPYWFATRNFHGEWYLDSDDLEKLVPFRENIESEEYFRRLAAGLPWYFRLAPLAPASLIKFFMKKVAETSGLGPLWWKKRADKEMQIKAFFGSREEWSRIPGWKDFPFRSRNDKPRVLNHGYDETKPEVELDIEDMRKAAEYRGGKCLSERMVRGDLDTKLEWECAFGHRFVASPRLILKGGHWCPECLPTPWRYDAEAKVNPFLAQVWYAGHSPEENEVYEK